MKIVKRENAEKFSNSDTCIGVEYPLQDKGINVSTATIKGRYPESGYCVNLECKELIYVLKGSGMIQKQVEKIDFEEADTILIEKGEKYYWEGDCQILMACTPAWYPEQHKLVEE